MYHCAISPNDVYSNFCWSSEYSLTSYEEVSLFGWPPILLVFISTKQVTLLIILTQLHNSLTLKLNQTSKTRGWLYSDISPYKLSERSLIIIKQILKDHLNFPGNPRITILATNEVVSWLNVFGWNDTWLKYGLGSAPFLTDILIETSRKWSDQLVGQI